MTRQMMTRRRMTLNRAATRLAVAGVLSVALASGAACSDSSNGSDDAAGVDTPPSPSETSSTPSEPAAETLTSLTDSFDDDQNGWALPPSEEGSTTVAGGDFVWDFNVFQLRPHLIATTVGTAFDNGTLEMTDVTVTASGTMQRGAPAMGVFCREVTDTDSDFQWYEFVVRDGYAAIRLADSGGNLEVLATSEDAEVPMGKPVTIEGTCVGGALSLALDGTELLTADVSEPLGNGGAGLQAYDAAEADADEPMKIAWHDFSVEPAS